MTDILLEEEQLTGFTVDVEHDEIVVKRAKYILRRIFSSIMLQCLNSI